jgi:hypothetical protein
MTIEAEIKKASPVGFRRLYIKRRQTDGEYESDWQEIDAKYIKKYGNVDFGIDDIKVNFYKYSGLQFTVQNTDGFFSDENDNKSLWYGYLNRYRSLIKLEGGYEASDGTEYPTDPSLFIGIMDESMVYKEDNLINYNCNHISRIFEEFPASNVTGIGSTQTAKNVIEKIRDHTDSNGTALFQKYITSGGWNITSSSNNYNMATTGSLEGISCWELIKKLAEAENHIAYIDRLGDFYFTQKTSGATPVYHFSGIGEDHPTHGVNIIGKITVDENVKQVYNRILITYDTTSTNLIKQETWNWGDSSSSFRFGVRTYEYENEWMGATTASNLADSLFDYYSEPKKLTKFDSKFVPQLDIYDYVTLTYKTVSKTGDYLWNEVNWGEGFWGKRSGFNINEVGSTYYVEKLKHSIDKFTTSVVLRER